MRKMKNKFIALLVVFTSIISFLPAGFGGQTAKAADITIPEEARIHVYDGSGNVPTEITAATDSKNGEQYYPSKFTQNQSGTIDIALKNVSTTQSAVYSEAYDKSLTSSGSITKITEQKVEITAVNGITWTSDADRDTKLKELDMSIIASSYPGIIGQRINGMPLGVNKIKYNITVTTTTYKYTAPVYEYNTTTKTNDLKTPASVSTAEVNPITYSNQEATIYFGAEYITNVINAMTFKAYVGDSAYFDANDDITNTDALKNNESPFLYTTEKATPDSSMPLKYTFDVPFSLTKLGYIMNFKDSSYSSAIMYKNGIKAGTGDFTITNDITNNTTKIAGSLGKPGAQDLILIRINASNNIKRTICIEVDYNYPEAKTDYTLYKSGITKGKYQSDDNIDAYVGKKFTVEKINNYTEYKGNIYVDKKAETISVDPTLIADKDKNEDQRTLAYVVTNHYYDPVSKSNKIVEATLNNGKRYVYLDTNTNSTNTLYVDVYQGKNGNADTSTPLLARYILNVNFVTNSNSDKVFSMGLAFDNSSSSTYLTQPGVADNKINFSADRRTYDLYADKDTVKVSYTGTKSEHNEYLKFWTATGTNSSNLVSATVIQNNDDYTVKLTGSKKLVVQACYDSTTGAAATYTVGEKYVFYLPNNYDSSDTTPIDDSNSKSNDASLSALGVTDATLKQSSGTVGFSSSVYDYTTTVKKENTTATVTATASNAKSIVASINGSDQSYDLVSGQGTELPLNSKGVTTVEIVVTAQDGTTTKTYNVTIKNDSKSSTGTLKNVILNTGDYTFDPKEDTTKVRVDQNINTIKVTPIPDDSKSKVTVNGDKYSDTPISVSLKGSQKTEIEIVVTSEDGTESNTYTLEINRVDSSDWNNNSTDNSGDQYDDDQYYDEYNDCWVDTTKYEEWGTVNGKAVYFDKKGRQVKNAWISTGGKYYYLNNLGYRASGWKVDDKTGQTYYLDSTTGEMKKEWMNLNGSWYYLGKNGLMHKGWLYLNGKWYYFAPNGQMVVNQSMFIEDKTYKFGQDGAVIF